MHGRHFSEEDDTVVNLARRGILIENTELPGKPSAESSGCIRIRLQVQVHHIVVRRSIPDRGQCGAVTEKKLMGVEVCWYDPVGKS